MRILLTNDDGIAAPGLVALEAIANALSDDVWVIAPASEQSGVGHCINYARPTMINQIGAKRYAIEGSPADCVLVGLHDVMKDAPPDLILSGVNRGNNAGENTLYSGTIGACIEAALQGYNAIALSQFYGPDNVELDDPFAAAVTHGAQLIRDLRDQEGEEEDEAAPKERRPRPRRPRDAALRVEAAEGVVEHAFDNVGGETSGPAALRPRH